MILLDFDNLNILVLFILAFISFKSYQADHHLLESESDQELSQVQHSQTNHEDGEKIQGQAQMRSQTNQQQEENSLCPQKQEKEEMKILNQPKMVSEQIAQSQNSPPVTQNHQIIEYPQIAEQSQLEGRDDEIQNENEESISSVKNPESEPYSAEQADDEEEEQEIQGQSGNGVEKRKKIRKVQRKAKREPIKSADLLVGELIQEIQIQSG